MSWFPTLLLIVIRIIVLVLLQIFYLNKQIHLKGEWEVAISEISYPSLYQNVTEGKFTFVDGRESSEEKRKIVPMNIEPGLYPSIVDIVVAMNNKIRERLGAQVFE